MVNTFLIGAQKCGTTTLSAMLHEHPDVSISSIKEPNYFSVSNMTLSEYHAGYDFKRKIRIDASTTYSMKHLYPNVARSIFQYNQSSKIVYLVRDPIDRIQSHYNFQLGKGYQLSEETLVSNTHFMSTSRYYYQISDYLLFFGRPNIKIINFGELVSNSEKVLVDLFKFLEITAISIPLVHKNESIGVVRVPTRAYNRIASKKIVGPILRSNPIFPGLVKKVLKSMKGVEINKKRYLSDNVKNQIMKEIYPDLQQFEKVFNLKLH